MFVSSDDADLTPAFTIIISPKVHTPLTRPGKKHLLTRPDVGGGVGLKKKNGVVIMINLLVLERSGR